MGVCLGKPTAEENKVVPLQIDVEDIEKADLQLITKIVCMCELSYIDKNMTVDWKTNLNLAEFNLHTFTSEVQKLAEEALAKAMKGNEPKEGTAEVPTENAAPVEERPPDGQTVTGFIPKLNDVYHGNSPFICIRGTSGTNDMISDLGSVVPYSFSTVKKDKTSYTTGAGFYYKHQHHREELIAKVMGFYNDKKITETSPLIICGHSLGGALAVLLVAELMIDYPEMFNAVPVVLVTVGAPRTFDKEFAITMGKEFSKFRYLRLVNHDDPVPILPPVKLDVVYHGGELFVFEPKSKAFKSYKGVDSFNYPPDEMFASAMKTSMLNKMACHSMTTTSGYLGRILASPIANHVDALVHIAEYRKHIIADPDVAKEAKEKANAAAAATAEAAKKAFNNKVGALSFGGDKGAMFGGGSSDAKKER